ncbi:MAG: hypothetical protein HZA78_08200 [Candidatus Schekmanbacteria bacterium]|nr:hypothetical protein [Candidatus Schekmanbacteria bacterium]
MATMVAKMTKDELKEMIGTIVEEKLIELIGYPEEELPIKKSLYSRLLQQKMSVAKGERGEVFDDVVKQLGLE